jgi:serine/threonine-protein kinase
LEARLIAGTSNENPIFPFFSPDGKWIGYGSLADGRLKKIAIGGGAPVTVCDVGGVFAGGSWNTNNTIVFIQIPGDIKHVSADGGTPEILFKTEGGNLYSAPQWLPDGKSVLFTKVGFQQIPITSQIMVQSIGMEEPSELFAGYFARYLPTGHIVYTVGDNIADIEGHNLFAVPFDPDKLEVTGGQVSLVEDIRGLYGVHYAVSDSGTLVYMPSLGGTGAGNSSSGGRTLAWVDRKGEENPLSAPPDNYGNIRISPDGTRVALAVTAGGNADIWIWDVKRETRTRLTFDAAADSSPLWTPDGKRIAFASGQGQEGLFGGVYWKAADGTGEIEKLGSLPDRAMMPWSWSGDGKIMVMQEFTMTPMQLDIGMLAMEGERARTPLLQEKHNETTPLISPNGRWMAYTSNESGEAEIYVSAFPDVDKGKWQVSTNGGTYPLWSPDGRELFYREGDAAMAVRVETEPVFNAGKPVMLFKGTYADLWDTSPDGKRFLMIKPGESAADGAPAEIPRKIIVVLNWLNELKDRVPVE